MTAPRLKNAEFPVSRQMYFPGSLIVVKGDLLFDYGIGVKPTVTRGNDLVETAAQFTDLGSKILNQMYFAANFAGVANDARGVYDPAPTGGVVALFPVLTDVDAIYDCVSSTFEEGDMVGATEFTSGALNGTALMPQKLEKVTDPACAIGYVTQREATAVTRVHVRLISKLQPHAIAPPAGIVATGTAVAATLTGDRVLVGTDARHLQLDPGGAGRNIDLPAISAWPNQMFYIENTADAAEVLTIRLTGGGATKATPTQNEAAVVWNDGTTVYAFVVGLN